MAIFMVAIVVVTTRGHGAGAMVIALLETMPLVFLFVVLRPLDGAQGLQEGHGRAREPARPA